MEHQKPLCAYCHIVFERLGVWTDLERRTAIFFCINCGSAFSGQLLQEIIEENKDHGS